MRISEWSSDVCSSDLGETFDMDDWRGRWVAVNFFASWCIPCMEEHPELVAFDEAHREAGDAAVVSFTYDDRTDDAKEFFAKRSEEHTSELQSLMRISYAVF